MNVFVFFALLVVAWAQIPLCPPLTETPIPTDVRLLDVNHLRAIGAVGDSISVGFAINGAGESPEEAFSIGGLPGVPSMANLIRNQNLNITGLSVPGDRGLNVAVSGAVVAGMPAQADNFITALLANPLVDFANDWKMLTIWIGGNNICNACSGGANDTPQAFERDLDLALGLLYDRVPRLAVNLVTQFNFSSMYDVSGNELRCFLNRILCPCVMTGPDEQRDAMNVVAQGYNVAMRFLTDKYNSGARNDFGVILHTMGIDSSIPDINYLATLDCFHPSRIAHDGIGINGFNQLFVPPEFKSRIIDFGALPICATDINKRIFIG